MDFDPLPSNFNEKRNNKFWAITTNRVVWLCQRGATK